MDAAAAPSTPRAGERKYLGLLVAALLGWIMIIARLVLWPVVVAQFGDSAYASQAREQAMPLVILLAIFGLPIALFASFAAGLPLWAIANRLRLRELWHGALLGAAAGTLILSFWTLFETIGGLRYALDPDLYSSYSAGGALIVSDGLLTAYGWQLRGIELLYFAFAGAIAGLAAWKVSGIQRTSV